MTNHVGGHPPFDLKTADQLLDKLATDDRFRTLFKEDAEKALGKIGYHLPSDASPLRCTTVEKLASKEEISASRDALREKLTGTNPLTVIFCFEAGKVSSFTQDK